MVRICVLDGEDARLEGLQLVAAMPVEASLQTVLRTVASFLVKPLADRSPRPPTLASSLRKNLSVFPQTASRLLKKSVAVASQG